MIKIVYWLLFILCQGREDNPVHKKAFNVLIKNLKEKTPKWGRTSLDCERSITRILSNRQKTINLKNTAHNDKT